jgi:hypothetical protein
MDLCKNLSHIIKRFIVVILIRFLTTSLTAQTLTITFNGSNTSVSKDIKLTNQEEGGITGYFIDQFILSSFIKCGFPSGCC